MNDARGHHDTPVTSDIVEFRVIGELKANPHHLLLLSDDGGCYDYDILGGEIAPLEPDDSWAVDIIVSASPRIEADAAMLAS